MKNILTFCFLLFTVSAFAQYPATPTTKQELGRQTTGDGLIYRGSGAPNYTPVNNRNAWIYYDTINNRLFKSRLGAWSLMIQDTSAFNEIQMPYIVDDTLYLTNNVTGEPLTAYVNRVWPIAALSDTTTITGENQGDVAFVTGGTAVAFRGSAYWNPFSGGGGGGSFTDFIVAADSGSPATISDGETVTTAGGYGVNTAISGNTVTVEVDTAQLATQSDISGFGTMSSFTLAGTSGTPQTITNGNTATIAAGTGITTTAGATDQVTVAINADSIAAWPSGTGTNLRIPVWTGTNSLGSSTLLQSAAGLTLDANLAFRPTGGTTASRPTGAAGMQYYNTSNNWFDLHNGTSWFNPLRSATATGLGTAGRVFYADASGAAAADDLLSWDATNNYLGVNIASPLAGLHVAGSTSDGATMFCTNSLASGYTRFQLNNSTGAKGYFTIYGSTFVTAAVRNYVVSASSASPFILATDFDSSSGGTSPLLFYTGGNASTQERMRITSTGSVGIGTTTPTNLLDIKSTGAAANAVATITSTGTGAANGYAYVGYGTDAGAARWSVGTAGSGETFYGVSDDFFWLSDALRMVLTRTGLLGIGTSSPDRLLHSELSDAVTNAMVFPLRLTHITSGTAAAGSGAGIEFEAESAGGTNRVSATIENPYTTATNAAEVSDLVFKTMRAGTLTESLRSKGDGTLRPATLTGTATKLVGATSDNTLTAIAATITTAGTTGNITINALAGTVNIAAAGTTVTVTNSNVTANSLVFCTLRTNDTTATVKNVVPGAGSFVINLGAAATGEVSIGFFVVN